MSSDGHVGRAMKEVGQTLAEDDASLKSKVKEPMTPYHRPRVRRDPGVRQQKGNYLPSACRDPVLGLRAWARGLMEVATLSRSLTAPCEGHLQEVFRILDTCFPTSSMAFDDSEPVHDAKGFTECD
jgi:hypothetical protein